MSWGAVEWEAFCGLLGAWWPGDLSPDDAEAWRMALDGTEPSVAIEALKVLLHEGRRFRPSASELLAAIRNDPSEPTFDEMLILVRRAAKRDGQDDRALAHPLVASFVARQGWDRLRLLPIDDPDWGEKHRRDLYGAWERHRESHDHRQVAALASGRGDLAQLDPLATLGLPRSAGELVVSNDNQRRAT
jgi:hypothetical protein